MPVESEKREIVERIIIAVLASTKHAVTLTSLENYYREEEGVPIPWTKLGYASLLDFLKSMRKHVQIEVRDGTHYIRGFSEKTKHISSLVARQKTDRKQQAAESRRSYRPSHYFPTTPQPRIYIPADILSDIVRLVRDKPKGVSKIHLLNIVHKTMPHVSISDLDSQLRELSHELYVDGNFVIPVVRETDTITKKSPNIEPAKFVEADYEPVKDTDDEFIYIPSGCTGRPSTPSTKKTKKATSYFLQESLMQQGYMENVKNEYDYQKDIKEESNDNVSKEYEEEETLLLLNDRTRLRLQELVKKYPQGIWCADLPEMYLKEYKVTLNYKALGFNSISEFASHLPSIFRIKRPTGKGDYILYSTDISQEADQEHSATTSSEHANPLTSEQLNLGDVMLVGESVDHWLVSDLICDIKQYIEVYVVEVFTPSFFWIQLRGVKHIFEQLMKDLHEFYIEEHKRYKIPEDLVKEGLNCACIYNNAWHRGIIKTVRRVPHVEATIMFYDYGTLKTYHASDLYYLHKSFSYLPAQAIPCGLVNIKPCFGDKWSRGATYQFSLRTLDIPLIAIVASVDAETNSMLVSLTDTLDVDDVHINDWMVEKNLAMHGTMVRIRPKHFAFSYYLDTVQHAKERSLCKEGIMKFLLKIVKNVGKNDKNYLPLQQMQNHSSNNIGNTCMLQNSPVHTTGSSKPLAARELLALHKTIKNLNVSDSNDNLSKTSGTTGNSKNDANENNLRDQDTTRPSRQNRLLRLLSDRSKRSLINEASYSNQMESSNQCNSSNDLHLEDQKKSLTKITRQTSRTSVDTRNAPPETPLIQSSFLKSSSEHFYDEKYFGAFSSLYGGQGRDVKIDWTEMNNNVKAGKSASLHKNTNVNQEKQEAILEEQIDIPRANKCFLNAVHNSPSLRLLNKDSCWLPSGNMCGSQNATDAMQTKITKIKTNKNVVVCIPEHVAKVLRKDSSCMSNNLNTLSNCSLEKVNIEKNIADIPQLNVDDQSSIASTENAQYIEYSKSRDSPSTPPESSIIKSPTRTLQKQLDNNSCHSEINNCLPEGIMNTSKDSPVSSESLDDETCNQVTNLEGDTHVSARQKLDIVIDDTGNQEIQSESFSKVTENNVGKCTERHTSYSNIHNSKLTILNFLNRTQISSGGSELDSDDLTSVEEYSDRECEIEKRDEKDVIYTNHENEIVFAKEVRSNCETILCENNGCETMADNVVAESTESFNQECSAYEPTDKNKVAQLMESLDHECNASGKNEVAKSVESLNHDSVENMFSSVETATEENNLITNSVFKQSEVNQSIASTVPGFNDVDIDTNDEEWEVYGDINDFLKLIPHSVLNNALTSSSMPQSECCKNDQENNKTTVDETLNNKTTDINEGVKIEEIIDSPLEVQDVEEKSTMKLTSHVGWEPRGKAKTLAAMLNTLRSQQNGVSI